MFEIELIKQVEINVDYILMLVTEYIKAKGSGTDHEIKAAIDRAVSSSPSLRSKKDLVDDFVETVSSQRQVGEQWQQYIKSRRAQELDKIISDENLRPEPTRAFVSNAFRDGAIPTGGTGITEILPPVPRFRRNTDAEGGYSQKKRQVLEKLTAFYERFAGLTTPDGEE